MGDDMRTVAMRAPGLQVRQSLAATLRKGVVNWIFATIVVSIGVYVLVPTVIRAREAARLTPCLNHLFQHSGCHQTDIVYLNHDFKLHRVSSCPVCSGPDAPLLFVVGRENGADEFLRENEVPASVVLDAKEYLEFIKQQGSYRRRQQSFSNLKR